MCSNTLQTQLQKFCYTSSTVSWRDWTKVDVMQMQVVEIFQSLLLSTCASGHHIFFCVSTLYIRNKRCACLCFFFWMLNESMSWMIATGWLAESLIVFGSTVSVVTTSSLSFDSPCVSFGLEIKMRTADVFFAPGSYFNPTDSVAAAILCKRLSLYGGLGLETSNSTGALPDPISPAEVKPVFLPEIGLPCKQLHRWIWMDHDEFRSFSKMCDDTIKTESAET